MKQLAMNGYVGVLLEGVGSCFVEVIKWDKIPQAENMNMWETQTSSSTHNSQYRTLKHV